MLLIGLGLLLLGGGLFTRTPLLSTFLLIEGVLMTWPLLGGN